MKLLSTQAGRLALDETKFLDTITYQLYDRFKMAIELNQISMRFGSKWVLETIQLHLPQGKTHVLLGSSGCGKSTLLRIILGLAVPTTGEVSICGKKMTPLSQRELARQIGYVIQDGGLFPHLTAEKNVILVAQTLGWSSDRIASRMRELFELVGLDAQILKRYPKQLSGGQRQRIGIMRACFLDPEVMLLDEPLGALDPIIRADLQKELKKLFDRLHKTVVLVTHDMGEAAFFGDTITLLNQGKIIQHGVFSELLDYPKDPFVSEFINAQRPWDHSSKK